MADPELMARMAEVASEPDKYPIPPREGPSRRTLLAQLGCPLPEGDADDELVA
jgi:hypothetical protein